ncbi:hypothetical protein CARUB_v10002738mg [Capsella rubella]|uniref:TF-B3 domain-containing protein n=1 Tax=Capsella rubella TaxID=81985 RepID=R0HAY7_9BRAS|nr:hypothetical protein CARUB_v10002738mg [Capsella rubella]
MEDFRIDGDMIISKVLSHSDVDRRGNLLLPKSQMLSVFKKMNDVTTKSLKREYILGTGWTNLRKSLGLKEGDNIKLYWDYLNYKFIILNFEYNLIPESL